MFESRGLVVVIGGVDVVEGGRRLRAAIAGLRHWLLLLLLLLCLVVWGGGSGGGALGDVDGGLASRCLALRCRAG